MTIEIEDHGGGFDPDGLSSLPKASDPARLEHERGLGIPLVRALADDVQFLVKDEGTIVRVVLFTPVPSTEVVLDRRVGGPRCGTGGCPSGW